jgi:predicted dehydrogenase
MSTVGVGILGFAHGHVHAYCERWLAEPRLGVRPVAGWDHDAERAGEGCARHGIEEAPSPAAVLSRDDIRAVVIAAETSMHAGLVEEAVAAGKAIVLQKPMALTMEEADRIVSAVAAADVPFTMAWQMRVDPHNLQARELVDSGALGRVFMVRRRHCLSTQLWPDFEKSWHVQPALNRDIFADDASHAVDFVYWLMGMPASVTAELGTLLNPAIRNDHGIAVFRYADGAFAEVSCSFVAFGGENTLEIHGEKGVIIGNYGDAPSSALPRLPGSVQLRWHLHGADGWTVSNLPDVAGQGDRIAGLAGPLAEFLHGNRPPVATAEEGRDVLRLVLACYESAGEGRRVALTEH